MISPSDKLLVEDLILEKLAETAVPLSVMEVAVLLGFKRPMLADNYNLVRDALRRLKTKCRVDVAGFAEEQGEGKVYRLKAERPY